MAIDINKSLLFRNFIEFDDDFYLLGDCATGFDPENAETEFRDQRWKSDGVDDNDLLIYNGTGSTLTWHCLYVGGIRCAERCSITLIRGLTPIGTYTDWDFGRGQFVVIFPDTIIGVNDIDNDEALTIRFNVSSPSIQTEVGVVRIADYIMNIQNQIPIGLEYNLNPVTGIEKFETPGGNVYTSENYIEKYVKTFSFEARASLWTKFWQELKQKRISETSLMILSPRTNEQASYSACFGKIINHSLVGSLKGGTHISGQITMQEQ